MKRTKLASLLLALTMTTGLCTGVAGAADAAPEGAAINSQTVWSYTDNGTDPAGDANAEGYDRTSWTKAGYDTTDWATGTPSFGAKKGAIADLGGGCTPKTLLKQYKEDGTTDIEAYFFRTTVQVADPGAVTAIEGTVIYDDSATVYVNGHKIAGFDDESITANLQYGGSNAGDPITGTISYTENLSDVLVQGENVVAVEIHQGRASSSDIYFDMPELNFSTEPVAPAAPQQGSVSISMGADATQRNFTWYSDADGEGTLLIAEASAVKNGEMPANAAAYSATGKATNRTGFYSYQATAKGLAANTRYAYQMVNGDTKTEIGYVTTGGTDAFSFAFAGDPQIGASGSTISDTDGWEKTLGLIASSDQLKGVDFLLSAGDQVNKASDETQYDGYLNHSKLLELPVATVVGNHDSSSAAYDEHFNVPNESTLGSTAASSDYYFVYNHVLFLALNSNNMSTAEHKAFMEQAIAATADQNITWKVVTFHHSIYSVANHAVESDILQRRNELVPVLKDLDIDVVLMGHDHVYCRTYMMDGLTPMTDASLYDDADYSSITNPTGILYVTANSASGSKFYTIQQNQDFSYSRVMNQERVPNISRVDVSDGAFTITTYRTSDLSVVDSFTIYHKQAYNVAVTATEHGTAAAGAEQAYAGDTVTLTATPDEGYRFVGWKVVSGDVTVTDNSFVMPEGDVELEAQFEHIHTFSDKWSFDENGHWHDCTEPDGARSDEAEHTYAWVVDQAATAEQTGLKHEECTVCGAKRSENTVIAKLDKQNNQNQQSNQTNTSNQTGTTAQTQAKNGPRTGDYSALWLAVGAMAAAALAGTLIVVGRRKKERS